MRNNRNRSRSSRKTNNSNAGFTLVEIVISIGILAVVSLPLMHYFTNSIRYSSMMQTRQQATFLAQEITEGLLAESRLISKSTVSGEDTVYTVPYFEEKESDQIVGEKGELIITTMTDDYKVVVTIDNPGDWNKVQDLLDYRIDPFENIVHIDTTENTRAEFEFMGMHNTYRSNSAEGTSPAPVDEETIRENMSREMYVDLKKVDGSESEYRVRIWYEYKCPKVYNMEGELGGVWESTVMDKTVKNLQDLQHIYLVYNWCSNGDTVILTSDFNIDLELYVICQQRANGDKPSTGSYYLKVHTTGFQGTVSGYTNLESGQLQGDIGGFGSSGTVSSEDAKPSLVYTIHTKVYPKGDVDGEDLLAEITTTKGE